MFREVTRFKQALPVEECRKILQKSLRGVLSVAGDDGYPYGMPLNHFYLEEENRLYFHCGKTGYRTDCLKRCDKASFCVLDDGEKTEDWALRFRSVIAFGKVRFIEDQEEICRISRLLSRKFTNDEAYIDREIEKYGRSTAMFYLEIEHMTGKSVHEK